MKKRKIVFRATARKYQELLAESKAAHAALDYLLREADVPEDETEEQRLRREEEEAAADHRRRYAWWRLLSTRLTARGRAKLGFKTPSRARKIDIRIRREWPRPRRAVFRREE